MISTLKKNQNKTGDLFQQAMGSFETALRAGMKLQEDSVQRCVEILRNVGSPLEWERTVPAKVTKAIAAMQEHVDQSIRFMNDNAQQTVSLMETALQMHQANHDGEDGEDGDGEGDFWIYALNSMQTNAEIIRQANSRVLESWAELSKEVLERVEIMREEVNRVTEIGMRQV
jgi:hypothetical protein